MQQTMAWLLALSLCVGCSVQQKLERSAREKVLQSEALQTAHVGISVYEPATGKRWYDYQGDKYFVPASNIKIPTCYAAMKYLGDSLVGLRYGIPEDTWLKQKGIVITATADPSFLHEDFKSHPAYDFLQTQLVKNEKRPGFLFKKNKFERWGSGWSWNDYDAAYMAERSEFPSYGNVVTVELNERSQRTYVDTFLTPGKKRIGKVFKTTPKYFDSAVNLRRVWAGYDNVASDKPRLKISRSIGENVFTIEQSESQFSTTRVPFVAAHGWTTIDILRNIFQKRFALVAGDENSSFYTWDEEDGDVTQFQIKNWHNVHSQPTDSLLKPMMHRSDNFFAEQALLMVSNERLGYMSDAAIIDTLLKTDFADLPQKPRWADGSGLSRYNLFTPQDFVAILTKMKTEFGMPRLKEVFATGGEGTLASYYKTDSSFLYAKTGTLSGVVALSGFLTTRKGKELVFSVLVNNHQGSATAVRRAVEKFVQDLRREN